MVNRNQKTNGKKTYKTKASFAGDGKPLIIYGVVVAAALFSFILRYYDSDLSLNIMSEIFGAAFTLFVIDVLLVKPKTKHWLIVQEHVDYLIGRTVNRIRDGIASRLFSFKPEIDNHLIEEQVLMQIRNQRERFLNDLSLIRAEALSEKISEGFFCEDSYHYFNEKADDIWKLINMKYSEYLPPFLVSLLIELHTHMADVCSHIRTYEKSLKFPEEKEYYQTVGKKGVGNNMKEIIRIVVLLKEAGYSDTAREFSEVNKI